jgi:autophagy-related protein 2
MDFGLGSVYKSSARGKCALLRVEYADELFKVFESVVPSERTSLSFTIADVSIKTYAPSHPGSGILYIGEAELNTELAGNSKEFKFKLLVPSLSFLLVDSMADAPNGPGSVKTSGGSSLNLWKVISPSAHK